MASVEMPQPAAPGARGYTWHRIHLRMLEPLPAEPLFVLVEPLFPAYEIYINGERAGAFGGPLGGLSGQVYARPTIFEVPEKARELVIAIRSWDRIIPIGIQFANPADAL